MQRLTLSLLLALAIGGCATIDSPKPGAGGSSFEVRGKSYDAVWKAAVSVTSRSLTIMESNKDTGTIRAEKAASIDRKSVV